MNELFDILTSTAVYAAAVRLALPIFFAALGEVFAERSGLVNVGLEGMMLMAAFGGVLGADLTGSPVLGLFIGIVFALIVAAIQAYVAINLGGDQIVSGIALNIAALGITAYLSRTIWEAGDVPQIAGFGSLSPPVLSGIPVLGPILFEQTAFVYIGAVSVVAAWWSLTRTEWGLRLRACGEDPQASDSLGIDVISVRWQTMMICGALAGLGGAFLSLGELYTFSDGMSGGRGFIALAVVIIAGWSPLKVVWAAVFFSFFEALALRVQATNIDLPAELMLALPYVMTLIVYAIVVGRTSMPAALGRSYVRQ